MSAATNLAGNFKVGDLVEWALVGGPWEIKAIVSSMWVDIGEVGNNSWPPVWHTALVVDLTPWGLSGLPSIKYEVGDRIVLHDNRVGVIVLTDDMGHDYRIKLDTISVPVWVYNSQIRGLANPEWQGCKDFRRFFVNDEVLWEGRCAKVISHDKETGYKIQVETGGYYFVKEEALFPFNSKHCECGAKFSTFANGHSDWCPVYVKGVIK